MKRFRYWLIRKLAGTDRVVIGGDPLILPGKREIRDCVFIVPSNATAIVHTDNVTYTYPSGTAVAETS